MYKDIKHLLFDLDGSLLDMVQEDFQNAYFKAILETFVPKGYDPKELVHALGRSTIAMVNNDGKMSNKDIFWKNFSFMLSDKVLDDMPEFDRFYSEGFLKTKEVMKEREDIHYIHELKKLGYDLIIASNPIFPMIAQETRMRWANLNRDDFSYVTSYDNSSFCKPNIKYYEEICRKLNLNPKECMMIGNDVTEDMVASKINLDTFLLLPCLINRENKDISIYKRGTIKDLYDLLKD